MMKIFALLVVLLAAPMCFAQQMASVIAVNANMRGTPTDEGKVVQVIPQNTKLEVFKQKEAWFLVQAPEYVGWMHGNTIKLDPPPATAASNVTRRGNEPPITCTQAVTLRLPGVLVPPLQ